MVSYEIKFFLSFCSSSLVLTDVANEEPVKFGAFCCGFLENLLFFKLLLKRFSILMKELSLDLQDCVGYDTHSTRKYPVNLKTY